MPVNKMVPLRTNCITRKRILGTESAASLACIASQRSACMFSPISRLSRSSYRFPIGILLLGLGKRLHAAQIGKAIAIACDQR
jgi:hypothetical protein